MKKIKILLSGGGSGGPVTPLLAVAETLREREGLQTDFLWLGTDKGPERQMVEREGIRFIAISAGKLRRYFSWHNFADLMRIAGGFFQAFGQLRSFKPDVVVSAGAFVSVPVAWAAWILRIPVLIHQQDARPGLANKLMSPFARKISVTFEKSLADYGKKAVWIGNPIRQDFCRIKLTKREAMQKFGLRSEKPVLVVMGGGTGAQAINDLVEASIAELSRFCQVIHVTGQGKASERNTRLSEKYPDYKYFEFLDVFGVMKAFTVAEAIISRCGMSTLTELSQLGIASILIPMPDSHQEENAAIFAERDAALVLDQKNLDKERFVSELRALFGDQTRLTKFRSNIKTVMKPFANEGFGDLVVKLLNC